jgi:hypothetical protein
MSNTQHATGTPREQSARSTAETAASRTPSPGSTARSTSCLIARRSRPASSARPATSPELDQAFTILEGLLKDDPKTLDALDELDGERFNLVVMGWQAHLGANPGK